MSSTESTTAEPAHSQSWITFSTESGSTDALQLVFQSLVANDIVVSLIMRGGGATEGFITNTDQHGVTYVEPQHGTIRDAQAWQTLIALWHDHPDLVATQTVTWDQLTGVHLW